MKQFKTNDFPGGSVTKNLSANAGDTGDMCSIPDLGRCSGEGNYPFQYSCLENPINRRAGGATVRGITKKTSLKWLSMSSLGHAIIAVYIVV